MVPHVRAGLHNSCLLGGPNVSGWERLCAEFFIEVDCAYFITEALSHLWSVGGKACQLSASGCGSLALWKSSFSLIGLPSQSIWIGHLAWLCSWRAIAGNGSLGAQH